MSSNTINTLNDLLQKNYDACKGYEKAADIVQHPTMETYFKATSETRNRFASELKQEIQSLGGTPVDSSSVQAGAHRTWMSIRSTVAGNTDEVLLKECERGEQAALQDYNEALKASALPQNVISVIEKQRNQVENSLNQIHKFESVIS